MDFTNFSELRDFIRRYNSTSVLEVGTKKCWQKWETQPLSPLDWLADNIERNYTIRLMLLASAGKPHRHKNIDIEIFDALVNAYHSYNGHTISDQLILDEEAKVLLISIQKWEFDNEKQVRNRLLKLSDVLDLEVLRAHMSLLFVQRLVAFQNAGFGKPISRICRTIKLVELLDKKSNKGFSGKFLACLGLSPENYFKQFIACLSLFSQPFGKRGFYNFSRIPSMNIDDKLQKIGITPESIKLFVRQNSNTFSGKSKNSFRNKVTRNFNSVPDYYRPLFYNYFLETPFVELNNEEFCLPDPSSFTESCWNQISSFVDNLGHVFEDYLENVLFPCVCPTSFERIPVVVNPNSRKDKRADFLIRTLNSYIIVECKSSVMSSDTSAYFQADKISELWYRIHSAFEQIVATVEALNLHDKPVIPLVLTFYDSVAASTVFEEIVKQTDYCSRMGLNMPPVVRSLHEFEHFISDRSLDNWAELTLSSQNQFSPLKPDQKGHNYEHLNDVSIL